MGFGGWPLFRLKSDLAALFDEWNLSKKFCFCNKTSNIYACIKCRSIQTLKFRLQFAKISFFFMWTPFLKLLLCISASDSLYFGIYHPGNHCYFTHMESEHFFKFLHSHTRFQWLYFSAQWHPMHRHISVPSYEDAIYVLHSPQIGCSIPFLVRLPKRVRHFHHKEHQCRHFLTNKIQCLRQSKRFIPLNDMHFHYLLRLDDIPLYDFLNPDLSEVLRDVTRSIFSVPLDILFRLQIALPWELNP